MPPEGVGRPAQPGVFVSGDGRPLGDDDIHVVSAEEFLGNYRGGGTPGQKRSNRPYWMNNIPPPARGPADDSPPTAEKARGTRKRAPASEETKVAAAPRPARATPEKRILITFGRGEDTYSICVEVAPDWDLDGPPLLVSGRALVELYPILERLARIKDTTGQAFIETPAPVTASPPASAVGLPYDAEFYYESKLANPPERAAALGLVLAK